MYKICIADDEKYVQRSIAQRIESSGMEVEVAGTAGNGMEALELYEKVSPDIFFVDINMPVINGLDFIERIRRQDPDTHTRFIIISGYDDFAYMKKAIQLGVINYIKKPILQQEFSDMLWDILRQLEEDKERKDKKVENIFSWTDFLHAERQKKPEGTFLLIRGKEICRRAAEIRSEMEMPDLGMHCTVIRFFGVQDVLLLLWEEKYCTGRELEMLAGKACLAEVSQIVYHTGKCSNLEELAGQFEDMLNIRFYHPEYRLMKLKNIAYERPAISYEAFDAALDCTREDKYTECLNEILKPLFAEEKYCGLIKQVCQSLILIIANKYTKYDIQLPGELRQELFPFALAGCESRREIFGRLREYSLQLNQKIERIVSRSELVDRVIQYLTQHYREDINLSELAGEFFVVPTYLAKKFKEKKNCTVMQYLENIRLKKARELLDTSSLTISEISQLTGYNDPNYFARSFKKVYEISPREYRNSNGEGQE